ncbi:MAG: site-2 protease family protein [Desulfurococcaceae archaeon]
MNTWMFILGLVFVWVLMNIIHRFTSRGPKGLTVNLRYGVFLVVKKLHESKPGRGLAKIYSYMLIALFAIAFTWSIYTMALSIYSGLIGGVRGVVVLLPGYNIVGEDLLYFILVVFISVSLHELLHAKIALKSGIPVKSYGFVLALLLPAAFVEIDEEAFSKALRKAKIAILAAGVVINLLLAMTTMLIIPLLTSSTGFTLIEVEEGGLAYENGIRAYDVVYRINNAEANISYLRELLSIKETITIEFEIYRSGVGFISLNLVKPGDIDKLGVRIGPAPSKVILGVLPIPLFTSLLKTITWLFIVNFSLMFINTLPLFITDGGRIIREVLGSKLSNIVNYLFLSLLILMLITNAKI